MKTLTIKDPGTPFFCLAFPSPQRSKIDIIHEKETILFQDKDTGTEFQAVREDMIWYPMNLISDFHAKVCLQKTAQELRLEMMKKYNLNGADEICIIQFRRT